MQDEQAAQTAGKTTTEVRVGSVAAGQLVTITACVTEQLSPHQDRVALMAPSFGTGPDVVVAAHPDARCTVEVIAAT